MYRPDEWAMILEQARQEVKKNRLAYTSKEVKTISWDGVTDGRFVVDVGGNYYAKVSDVPIDFEKETPISVAITMSGVGEEYIYYNLQTSTFEDIDDGVILSSVLTESGKCFALSFLNNYQVEEQIFEKGLYFLYTDTGYASKLVYNAQTIHPIPQEYIPPLDRLILNGADGNQYALTITDGAISVAPVTT